MLDTGHKHSLLLGELEQAAATDEEAAAVAKAVGYTPPPEHSSLGQDDGEQRPQTPDSPNGGLLMSGENSPDDTRDVGVVMKSPELQNLDTPGVSSDEDSEDEGGVTMFPPQSQSLEESPAYENKRITLQENESLQDVSPGTTTPAIEPFSVSEDGKPAKPTSEESVEEPTSKKSAEEATSAESAEKS